MSPICVTCGASLPGNVRKCVTCECYQGTPCLNCGVPLPPDAKRCNACEAYQDGAPCTNCGALMPGTDGRCSKCLAFTGWRGWVPRSEVALALILSMISMLAAVVPPVVRWWNNRSVTETRIMGVEDYAVMEAGYSAAVPMIRVAVTNAGARPSFVRAAAISFDKGLGLPGVPLEIAEVRERYVRPDETSYLHLSAPDLVAKKLDPRILKDNNVTVTLQVEETLRFGGRGLEPRPDSVRASDIERWITHGAQ